MQRKIDSICFDIAAKYSYRCIITTSSVTGNNSDANAEIGNSSVFTTNVNGIITAKDNPTIDAGYICPNACVPITIQKTHYV